VSHFDLYNKMRQMKRNFRQPSTYQGGNRREHHDVRETGYRCPRCADVVLPDTRCLLCGVQSVPREATRTDAYTALTHFAQRAHRFDPFKGYWSGRGVRRHTSKLEAQRKRFPKVQTLAGAVGKVGRFRGVLTVLAPVREPLGDQRCGAYVTSRLETDTCICKPDCESLTRWTSYESDAGLVTLSDGKESAFIGLAGPHFRVWTTQRLEPKSAVVANTGDEVEFIGRLHARHNVSVEAGASTYRDGAITHLSLESLVLTPGWLVLRPE